MFHILVQKSIIIMLGHYSKKRTFRNKSPFIKEVGLVSDGIKTCFLRIYLNFYHYRFILTFHSRSIAPSCASQFTSSDYDQSLSPSIYELIDLREFHRHLCIRRLFKKKWKFPNIIYKFNRDAIQSNIYLTLQITLL